jgi:transposase
MFDLWVRKRVSAFPGRPLDLVAFGVNMDICPSDRGEAVMVYLELTPLQIWELRRHCQTAVGRVALRALMVLWRAEGLSFLEIAARLDCHRDTVSLWIERYQAFGLPGLDDEPRAGRPRHLDPASREQLETVLDQAPSEAELPHARWTLPHLRTVFLEVAPKAFSLSTLRRVVHDLGFRWRRPRLWAHKADPETFEKQLLIELAQQQTAAQPSDQASTDPDAVHFLYADASDHHLLAVLRSMWMRRGQQVRVATPPKNGHWALFGALNVQTGAFFWRPFAKAISENFLAFLEALLAAYPTGTLLLVVDNASYHTSHMVVDWLKQHDRILLLYLPDRRPDLNPVEKLWDGLKEAVSANRSFAHLEALLQFIQAFFTALPPPQALQLAGVRRDF